MEFFLEIKNKKLKFKQHITTENLKYFYPLLSKEFDTQKLFLFIDMNTLYTIEENVNMETHKFDFGAGEFKEFSGKSIETSEIISTIEFTGNCFLNKYFANYKKIQDFNELFWTELSKINFTQKKNYLILPGVIGIVV